MQEYPYIEMDIADAIIERPQPFEVDGVRFFIYPPTLGATIMIERNISALGFDAQEAEENPYKEALRACVESPDASARVIAMHTCRTKRELFDDELIEKRTLTISKADPEDMAALLVVILTRNTVHPFIKHLGLDREKQDMDRVSACKKQTGTYTFGGKSMYGTLIDHACERYGWTMQYVVWGISYQNLQMLLADSVQSIYLTDEERKNCHVMARDGKTINADDPENIARIAELLKER